jgi:hypothetical protein
MSDKAAPKPPKVGASKEEHRRFAKEVLDYEPYKREPQGGVGHDSVPDSEGPPVAER